MTLISRKKRDLSAQTRSNTQVKGVWEVQGLKGAGGIPEFS